MHRRRFLRALGVGAGSVVAGCLSGDGPASTPAESPSATTDTTASTPTGSPSATTDTPATPSMDAPFPPNRDDVDEVRWYRQVSNPEDSLVLEPSANTVSLPEAGLYFTLTNGTDQAFHTNFYGWTLYRWERGRWHRIAPTSVPQPIMSVTAGGSHTWTLTVDNTDLGAPVVETQGEADLTVAALGGGRYAFAIDGWWPDQEATPTHEHQTVRAARFTIEGDPLSLEPSRAVTDVERNGDTVTVTAENPSIEGSNEHARPATFVLARDDEATDPRLRVTEEVYRRWPLRDALAHAESDVEEVRVKSWTGSSSGFLTGYTPPVKYDGRTYRVSAEERGE